MNQPTQRRGLGRGLGSLIPTAPTHVPTAPTQASARTEEMVRRVDSASESAAPTAGGAHAGPSSEPAPAGGDCDSTSR